MSDKISEDKDKIDGYLGIIQERILAPIQKTEVRHYCTATLLLLFAAIDGLGGLLHPDNTAGSNARIREFLGYMGGDYKVYKKDLLNLRNFLVHSAINVESLLSQTEISRDQHLKKLGAADFIYVNTMVMYENFVDAFRRFRDEIENNPAMMKRAADRLEWRELREDNAVEYLNIPTPTPPPPVEFIYAKCRPKCH